MVNYILIYEIVKNNEIVRPKSVFMYMDRDNIVRMGPLWDFDWAFHPIDYGDHLSYFADAHGTISKHAFFRKFYSDPEFIESYKKRWNEMKSEIIDMENFMDQMKQKLELSSMANTAVWNLAFDFEEEIEKMKQWWRDRIIYLDAEINGL
jgi:spore coat protein CotH